MELPPASPAPTPITQEEREFLRGLPADQLKQLLGDSIVLTLGEADVLRVDARRNNSLVAFETVQNAIDRAFFGAMMRRPAVAGGPPPA